jgi:hypothetical protein
MEELLKFRAATAGFAAGKPRIIRLLKVLKKPNSLSVCLELHKYPIPELTEEMPAPTKLV